MFSKIFFYYIENNNSLRVSSSQITFWFVILFSIIKAAYNIKDAITKISINSINIQECNQRMWWGLGFYLIVLKDAE